jgi:hypothetical protein
VRPQWPEGPKNRGEIASNAAIAELKTALECASSHLVKSIGAEHAGVLVYGRLFRPSLGQQRTLRYGAREACSVDPWPENLAHLDFPH